MLSDFSRGIDNAIKKFQLVLDIENAIAVDMQGKILNAVKSQLDSIERKVDSQTMDTLLEKLIREDARAAAADYQRKVEFCHDKTCETMLSKIKRWANNVEPNEGQIFWLSGLAGTGKSTIAKTIARWADGEGILASTYFFSRDDAKLSEPSLLIPKIAFDVTEFDPSAKEIIAEVLKKDKRVLYTSETIEKQFQSLIAQPLAELSPRTAASPRKLMLLVVDSLDECSDRSAVKEIVHHLLDFLDGSNPHIRVLLTSRPEPYIRDAFNDGVKQGFINHNVEDFTDPRDIENYLHDELSKTYSQVEWREREDFKSLVEYSGKLFIYASTALRYIRGAQSTGDPLKRLERLLGRRTGASTNKAPYEKLDRLYLGILEQATDTNDSDEMLRFCRILGTIMQLNDPLPVSALVELLQIDESITNLRIQLGSLSSVIVVPPPDQPDTPIRFFHPSFSDFLKDRQRCTDRFLIDVSGTETFLSLRCLEVMVVGLPGNSTVRRSRLILQYACTNWAGHLAKSYPGDSQIRGNLKKFVQCCIHDWTRTVKTLLKERIIYTIVTSLETARDWATQSECIKDVSGIILNHYRRLIDEELPRAAGAFYESVQSTGRIEPCYLGTRFAILKEVKEWASNKDSETPSIFWLCESGGIGKSAIAMSIAQWGAEKEINNFRGGFFFDRQASQCDLRSFILTIAHDLALFYLPRMKLIADVLDSHKLDPEALIEKLLTKLELQEPILLLVDALDECDEEIAEKIIALLSMLAESTPHLRIFLTSRPEIHIQDAFKREDQRTFVLRSVDTDDPRSGEIEAYLCAELSRIDGDVDWQKRKDFKTLLEYCGDLFIHATTAFRYISNRNGDLETRIADVLKLNAGTTPDENPDKSIVNSEEEMQTRKILSMISGLRDTLPVRGLVELLGVDETSLRNRLKGLSCVISIPGLNTPNTPHIWPRI
ncbi:hypothetical protein SCHPADRAFT_508768, partial [Schizopora paradoxa]